jgi:hypothetical protein
MPRSLIVAGLLALAAAGSARAQTCAAYPNPLSNGVTADANQVMGNFNCAALLGAANFTGNVGVLDTVAPADNFDVNGHAIIGPAVERLSLSSSSLGFNRRVTNGAIFNSSVYAYQFQHVGSGTAANDYMGWQVYTPTGSTVTPVAISVNGAGNVSINTVQSTDQFYVNGSAGGTGAWINASDARLKTNVQEITGALALIERLRGVRYQWRPPEQREIGKTLTLPAGETQMGFIAQEVAPVAPEAVSAPKPGADAPFGMKEGALVALLVQGMKEQQAEIEALKAQVAALRSPK